MSTVQSDHRSTTTASPPPPPHHFTTGAQKEQKVPRTEELIAKVRYCESSKRDIYICYQCFGDPTCAMRPPQPSCHPSSTSSSSIGVSVTTPQSGASTTSLPPSRYPKVILLVGGLNMQMTAFDETFCEGLVRLGFFVVRFDNRDIGFSTKIELDPTKVTTTTTAETTKTPADSGGGAAAAAVAVASSSAGSPSSSASPSPAASTVKSTSTPASGTSDKKEEPVGHVRAPGLLLPESLAKLFFGEKLPYTINSMAKDALALMINVLHLPFFHILGISMGGMIAQAACLLAPDHILSLTSIMSTTNASDLPDAQLWVKLWMLRKPPKHLQNVAATKTTTGATAAANEVAAYNLDELLNFRVESQQRLLAETIPIDRNYLKNRFLLSLKRSSYGDGLLRQAAAIRRCEGRDQELWRHVRIPALVVHGARDLVVPPQHGYRTAQCLPFSRLLVFKRMGHYFHPSFFHPIGLAVQDMTEVAMRRAFPDGHSGGARTNFLWMSPSRSLSEREHQKPATPELPPRVAVVADVDRMEEVGELLMPVVASSTSRTGAAACAAINVAVPVAMSQTTKVTPGKPGQTPSAAAAASTAAATAAASKYYFAPDAVLVDLHDTSAVEALQQAGIAPLDYERMRAQQDTTRTPSRTPTCSPTSREGSSYTAVTGGAGGGGTSPTSRTSPSPAGSPAPAPVAAAAAGATPEGDAVYPFIPCSPSAWNKAPFPIAIPSGLLPMPGGATAAATREHMEKEAQQKTTVGKEEEEACGPLGGTPARLLVDNTAYFQFLQLYDNHNDYMDNLRYAHQLTHPSPIHSASTRCPTTPLVGLQPSSVALEEVTPPAAFGAQLATVVKVGDPEQEEEEDDMKDVTEAEGATAADVTATLEVPLLLHVNTEEDALLLFSALPSPVERDGGEAEGGKEYGSGGGPAHLRGSGICKVPLPGHAVRRSFAGEGS